MVLLKTSLLLFSLLVISCLAIDNQTNATTKVVVPNSVTASEGLNSTKDNNESTSPVPPIISNSNTITTNTTSSPNSIIPTTTQSPNSTTTTTQSPNSTTTLSPPTTSTTTTTPNPSSTTTLKPTSTTTLKPTSTTTTTPNPNSTTTSKPITSTSTPPEPTPTPARSWDGPSFFGGMVLAFGIVAVGFVGYRFFYLGRGSAYHTL